MSAGTKTFKVLVSFDSPENPGYATASATIKVPYVTDKEHAKHVVRCNYGTKLTNLRFIRATEVK